MRNDILASLQPTKVDTDGSGVLSFTELSTTAKRIYWLKGPASDRGGHAHKSLRQTMCVIEGYVEIEFTRSMDSRRITLHQGEKLDVPPGLWRDITRLPRGSILLVAASEHFLEEDYIRDYLEFERWVTSH